MKRVLLLITIVTTSVLGKAFAQNDAQVTKLYNFLIQESAEPGVKNYQQLGITDINSIMQKNIPGVEWVNGGAYVYRILWAGKKLAGKLDVSGLDKLETLYCEENELTELNVTNCPELKHLDCYTNKLNTVDVTTNTKLTYLCVRYNTLRKLDLSNNRLLNFLCSTGNMLDSLDLSGMNRLETAYCVGNQLVSLNLTGCTALKYFSCFENRLTTLDLSGLQRLIDLSCYRNKLTELNVTGCSGLQVFDCSDNEIETLDFSDSPTLIRLFCQKNRLTELTIDKCGMLMELDCNTNQLDSLKLPEETRLIRLNCSSNNLDFNSLPRVRPSYEQAYTFRPQNSRTTEVPYDNINSSRFYEVDLSQFYEVEGTISDYSWYEGNKYLRPEETSEGVFSFTDDYIGKSLICRISNQSFPLLVVRYDVTLTDSDREANETRESTKVYADNGCINVVADKPSEIAVYSVQGACVAIQKISEGRASIPVQRGAYIVTLNKKTSYKLIVN